MLTTDLVSIYTFQRIGNTEGYNASPEYTNVNACITPAGTDIQMTYGGEAGFQLYEIFIYDMTIAPKTADKIVTQSGATYLISGVAETVNNRYMHYIKIVGRLIV